MRRFHGRDSAVWMDGKVEPLAVLGPLLVQTGRVVVLMPHQIEVLAHQHLEHTWRHHALARALHQLAVTQRTRDCLSGGTKHQSSVLPLAKNLTTLLKRPADGILLQWGRKRQRRLLAAAVISSQFFIIRLHYMKKTVASAQRMDNPEFVSIFRVWNMIAISPLLGAA